MQHLLPMFVSRRFVTAVVAQKYNDISVFPFQQMHSSAEMMRKKCFKSYFSEYAKQNIPSQGQTVSSYRTFWMACQTKSYFNFCSFRLMSLWAMPHMWPISQNKLPMVDWSCGHACALALISYYGCKQLSPYQ